MDDVAGKIIAALLAAVVGGGITAVCSVAAIRVYIKWLFRDVEMLRADVEELKRQVAVLVANRRKSDRT